MTALANLKKALPMVVHAGVLRSWHCLRPRFSPSLTDAPAVFQRRVKIARKEWDA